MTPAAGVLETSPASRVGGILAAVAVQLLLAWALLAGLAVHMPHVVRESLSLFRVLPPVPLPPPERLRPHGTPSRVREGAASPPNLRSTATPVVAPVPIVLPPLPPPIPAASVAGTGADPTAGAALRPGPGTGSGGVGNGSGSGRFGDGAGDGGDETPPQWRRGRLKDSDYPFAAGESGFEGTVAVRYVVEADGRVGECTVTRSSGAPVLDETTCRLIRQRFRFDPSRDARGRPVASTIVESHSWVIEPDDRERRRN